MSTPVIVPILSTKTIDRSGSYDVTLGLASNLIVQRDIGTPLGDPVSVSFDSLALSVGSSIKVQHASLSVGTLLSANVLTDFEIGEGGRLDLSGAVGLNVASPIQFSGTGGILELDTDVTLDLLSGVTGFDLDDVIAFAGVPTATDVRYEGGRLIIDNGSTVVASVAVTGTFDPATLGFQSDGHGGINVGVGLGNGGGLPSDVFTGGLHSEYIVAQTSLGQLYLQDKVAGRDSLVTVSDAQYILFADGVGRFDANGIAEEVAHLYKAAFSRRPDADGLEFHTNNLESGRQTLQDVAHTFTISNEFRTVYDGLSDLDYIKTLYQNILGRAGEAAGIDFWLDTMVNGAGRDTVLLRFSESFENIQKSLSFTGDAEYGHAYRLYEAALDRQPETEGLNFWYNQLEKGVELSVVAQAFIDSDEFASHYGNLDNTTFVQQLYQNVLGRGADQAGEAYWTSALANGSTRADVLLGFSDSLEDRIQTADATHDSWIFLGAS